MANLVSAADLARLVGVTPGAVTLAVKRGTISPPIMTPDGKRFDADATIAEWKKNANPAQVRNVRKTYMQTPPAEAMELAQPTPKKRGRPPKERPAEGEGGEGAEGGPDFYLARARKEQANAELAEIKVQQERGQLLPAAEVRKRYADMVVAFRAKMLGIPRSLAPILAAVDDEAEAESVLREAIEQALLELAEA